MKKMLSMIAIILIAGCGGGTFTSGGPDDNLQGNFTVTTNAFIFGSDYPSDIVIPDIDGMRNTAFVVSLTSPSGVLAIDLESNPLKVSSKFAGLISPDGTGMPNALFIMSTTRAFLLTSSHVIDFNPTTGEVNTSVELLGQLTLDKYLLISSQFDIDNDGSEDRWIKTIDLNFPSGLAAASGKLYITMSNFISPIQPAVAAPGAVRIFDISDNEPYLSESKSPIITTDYNPTGVTPLPDGLIAVTNSGVSDVWDAVAHPLTNSSIDFLDPTTDQIIDNISLGSVALSFQEMAVTSDGTTAYIGSASFGEVYAVDLVNRTALYTHQSPITITGNTEGSDYISSQVLSQNDQYLFVASFDNSSIYPVDASKTPPEVLPQEFGEPFVLGFPKGVTEENPTGVNTGVGAIAMRPGIPTVDYSGPDLFALTGNPGTLATIDTNGTGASLIQAESDSNAGGEDEEQNAPQTDDGDDDGDSGGLPLVYIPTNLITIPHPQFIRFRIDPRLFEVFPHLLNNDDQEEIEILTEAPPGTDPFADEVVSFTPGSGAGFGQSKMPDVVLGPPEGTGDLGGSLDVVSLGAGGEIILRMNDFIIADGDGPDFTVFENAFYAGGNPDLPFSEAGIVSVSQDGVTFHEFDCDLDDSPHYPGCAGTKPTYANTANGIDPTDPEVSGGNQFDLADVGLTTARFVKIVDDGAAASVSGGTTVGFDLDAVAVINGTLP